ncbi:MAG: hypothetical protein QOF22_1051 [Bradyrhizobium sp.]|jgi:hypothetical protein|nr:hypothetical protein [Bradyrhizobium sp.]
MIRFSLLGVAAILSTTIATPVLAQAVIPTSNQGPGAYALYDSNGDLEIELAPSQREGRETYSMTSTSSLPSSKRGAETTTRPWGAPVGHRQPSVADVPASPPLVQESLDQEDANVNRMIRNICRGC